MSRKRDIEKALKDLGGSTTDSTTVREWVNDYLDRSLQDGFEVEYTHLSDEEKAGTGDDADGVCVKVSVGKGSMSMEFWIPVRDVPDWMDRDQLPVRG